MQLISPRDWCLFPLCCLIDKRSYFIVIQVRCATMENFFDNKLIPKGMIPIFG